MDYHDAVAKLPKQQQIISTIEENLAAAEKAEPTGDAKADKKARKQLGKLRDDLKKQREALETLQQKIAATEGDADAKAKADRHTGISQAVLQETAKLHAGDPENRQLWEDFLPRCRDEIDRIYKRLDVSFDQELGESFYHEQLANVVDQLKSKGMAKESEGAMCVFLDGFDAPMIIQKKDGAFLYATTDLATIDYRMNQWKPDAILYVVDFRQGDHFEKLFATAKQWGFDDVELSHVSFGTVLGEDGKPLKTRSGVLISLDSLLDEAVERAHKVVSENDDAKKSGAELDEAQRQHIAHVVGHAAIKYADLSQNRTSDYVFSYDKMVAMQGNTATYLQYSYARIQAIFAKGGVDADELRSSDAKILLGETQERNLAIQLLRFHESLEETIVDYRPNMLCNYLFQLSKNFSEFYAACPVLKSEGEKRDSRLLLCDLVARTMKCGLSLLGIQVIDKM
jgi:arginyl-tRNA synthetase